MSLIRAIRPIVLGASVCLLAAIASKDAHAAPILIHDPFDNENLGDGGPNSVNGGFTKVSNSVGGGNGSADELPAGFVSISPSGAPGNNNNTGIVSNGTFDAIGNAPLGFTTTWDVRGMSSFDTITYHGAKFMLQSDNQFFNNSNYIGIQLERENNQNWLRVLVDNSPGPTDEEFLHSQVIDATATADFSDGFTLSLTLDETGWSYTSDVPTFNASGLWSDSTFSNGLDDILSSTSHASAFVQGQDIAVLNINGITVTAIPEPATYALGLLGAIGIGMLVWRRRKP